MTVCYLATYRRMLHLLLNIHFVLSCLVNLSEANSTHLPRMTFTDREKAFKRLRLPGHGTPIQILQEGQLDTVTAAGQRHLHSVDFQNLHKSPVERSVLWGECTVDPTSRACHYNITVLHKGNKANQLFLCGTDGKETSCCNMNISEPSSLCTPSEHMANIKTSMKEGEPSVLIESAGRADLYITHSGAQDSVGIHKFGEKRVGPGNHGKEQQYVGLVLSRRREDPLQDKVYAFYKEKNTDLGYDSDMWLPFVAQVCMADHGGPKHYLQFVWTSQLNARLFCGDQDSRQYYSELVDVAALHADQWQDTRVYALFRNEWGMSAVCVYTIKDIDNIFTQSTFKGHSTGIPNEPRPGTCVLDSTKLPSDVLRIVHKNSEMEDRVLPLNNSDPLLVSHHHYTHICTDSFQNRHTMLFLSLENGRVHKAVETNTKAFFIADYRPFSQRAHILNMILHPSTRKLYVRTSSELVQLDVGSCAHYGDSCEECILARDPYCGWKDTRCTPHTRGTLQDVEKGNHTLCQNDGKVSRYSSVRSRGEAAGGITLPLRSKYFLRCPVSSHHAEYTWHHHGNTTACSPTEQQCLLLIDSMGPEQQGTYSCVLEEMGYTRTLAEYQLQLDSSAAGQASSPLAWVCLMAAVIMSLCY
ncbi:semaphorin-7A [Centroberyx gerrardi]